MRRALVLAALLASRTAVADEPARVPEATEDLSSPGPGDVTAPRDAKPEPTPPTPPPTKPGIRAPSDEPTALDAEGAPPPGQESGRTDTPAGDSLVRDVGQAVLTVPRVALEAAMAPVRVSIWAYDRYRLSDRFSQAFFDRTETYGLYPTAIIDSTYGINLGARVVHRNLLGAREKLSVRGTTGGQFRSLVDGSLRSGTRLGSRAVVELRGEYERRPGDRYFGVGNNSGAMETRYREELKRVTTYLDLAIADRLMLRATGALTDRAFGAGITNGTSIDQVYDTSMLTGFMGSENYYGELELRLDRRGRESSPGRHRIYDTGYMLSAFGGRVHQTRAGDDYTRYGGEAQGFIGLGPNPRSLMTRVHVEAVTGDVDDVVFNMLPALGGSQLLRGYSPTRFRDRIATVGTVEYTWGLGQLFLASAFVDAGRVYSTWSDVTTDGMRMGFGGSLQLHGGRQYIAGLTLASSIDGGFFASLTFDPVFDYDPRSERR
jgi:hypothetical protein